MLVSVDDRARARSTTSTSSAPRRRARYAGRWWAIARSAPSSRNRRRRRWIERAQPAFEGQQAEPGLDVRHRQDAPFAGEAVRTCANDPRSVPRTRDTHADGEAPPARTDAVYQHANTARHQTPILTISSTPNNVLLTHAAASSCAPMMKRSRVPVARAPALRRRRQLCAAPSARTARRPQSVAIRPRPRMNQVRRSSDRRAHGSRLVVARGRHRCASLPALGA